MLADVVLLDRRGDGLAGANELESALARSETGRGVVHVIVGGEPVVLDGRCTKIEEREVRSRLAEQAARRRKVCIRVPRSVTEAMRETGASQAPCGRAC